MRSGYLSYVEGDVGAINNGLRYLKESDLYRRDKAFKAHVDKVSAETDALASYVRSRLESKKV